MKRPFTRLDEASAATLARLSARRPSTSLLAERWPELVGPYLAGKLEPRPRAGGELELVLSDSRFRRAVEAVLPRLEQKVMAAFPEIKSVRLRSPV